ncbi:hypothetical protein PENSPDRAFT_343639 [Peniophora sp. CONT]|nr:hypothetical protein PENSPDRAFT_343639 [Peniophora sp. CONT]
MLSLHFTTLSFLLILEATAWPMMQLLERDDNSTNSSSTVTSDGSPKEDQSGMDLAMKALVFNFGYTALSANSSCAGADYPLEYACIEDNAHRCVDGTWTMALDCVSQSQKCYAVPGDKLANDPIVDCKSFDEVFDLFAELVDDCALGDPSGQAALFSYFYSMPDSVGDSPTGSSTSPAPMDTAPPMITTPAAAASTGGAQTTNVQTQIESAMTCKATDAGTSETASTGASPTMNSTPLPTAPTVDSSTATATSG